MRFQQMNPRYFLICTTVVLCFVSGVTLADTYVNDKKITNIDAKHVVEAALKDLGYNVRLPKFELDEENDPYFPSDYQFGASYDTPTRFARIGTYKVDSHTGEIWDVISCKRLQSSSVAQVQQSLRLKYGLAKINKKTRPPCSS